MQSFLGPGGDSETSGQTERGEIREPGKQDISVALPACAPLPSRFSVRWFSSFFALPFASSLSSSLPWLQCHPYMKCICVPGMGAKGLVGLRTGWLYMTGCGAIMGTPPI